MKEAVLDVNLANITYDRLERVGFRSSSLETQVSRESISENDYWFLRQLFNLHLYELWLDILQIDDELMKMNLIKRFRIHNTVRENLQNEYEKSIN